MSSDTSRPGLVQSVRLIPLAAALGPLSDGNLDEASQIVGVALPGFFRAPDAIRLWRLRAVQVAAEPDSAQWIARAAAAGPQDLVVGHAGFHGPPDVGGMVEVGYAVDPAHRRQGYATAMLRELLRWAAAEPGVTTVRASVSPDNVASLATIAKFGFAPNGEQWDEEDGLELIFERPA